MLTGNGAVQDQVWAWYRSTLVPGQIRPDGSCPREEARTRSLSYSTFNLDAFSVLCRLAQLGGVDLWHFRAADGASLEKAVENLMPYVLHPEKWTKPQISPFEPDRIVFPGLTAMGLRSAELLKAYAGLPRANSCWIMLIDAIVKSTG
jgi:Alginate lyase